MSLAAMLALVVIPGSGPPPVPGDAALYWNIDDQLSNIEARADGEACSGGVHFPAALHRVVDLRYDLRRLERYVSPDPNWAQLRAAARARQEERVCVGYPDFRRLLRSASRDLSTLQQHARRAGFHRRRQED